jgi:LysM repeat protein
MRRFTLKQTFFIFIISMVLISLGATWIMAQETGEESPLAAGDIYTVQRGDALDQIAATFDVQTGCLATANELTAPYHLETGQTLRIDFTCPRYDGPDFVVNPREDASGQGGGGDSDQGGGSATGGANTYRVQRGDVLDLVAAEFDVQTGCLATANELTAPYHLEIGQILNIDLGCPPYDGEAFVPNPREDASGQGGGDSDQGGGGATGGANTYRVQRGDVLDLVAAEFDVQTGCLATANELTAPYHLEIGQIVNIDLSCPPYDGEAFVPNPRSEEELGQGGGGATGGANTYRVQRGDVLDLVAAEFDVQTGCLATANELTAPYHLEIGQILKIDLSCPPYDGTAFVPNPRSEEELGQGGGGATGGANTYRVQRGDVLDLVAAEFDVQTGCLARANELEAPFHLAIGQVLNIDLSCPRYSGEAPVLNPRDDADLGQGGGGTSASTYFVERGDVLDLIALQYNVQLGCLAAANGLEAPYRLDIGQQIAIDRSCPPYDGGSTPPLNEQGTATG